MFQVAISWMHEHGGIVGLDLAKCAITTIAVCLLVTARRRPWPVWVMLLAWLPAIMVLSGRMYVRPETLTLLYLSIFLAVIIRWDRNPRLAWLLPMTQVAWVNSQGLFVLGPIVLGFALLDSALSPASYAPGRRKWWRTILLASLATGLACLVNPYGIHGALYPLELAATMRDPIFSKQVAELMTIPDFIQSSTGWRNLPLQLHALTMILGALSFVIPIFWVAGTRLFGAPDRKTDLDLGSKEPVKRRAAENEPDRKRSRPKPAKSRSSKAKGTKPGAEGSRAEPLTWRPSFLRLLLFASFSALSLQATRNSHQFAAVVGTITAWNFGEWAYVLSRRRAANVGTGFAPESHVWLPRMITGGAILAVIAWVGTGWFYEMTGEKRVVGLHEEPLWFPHEAARFAGGPGMPNRFISFHNANAAVFEYYHGPEKKVYTDPRLEVAGAKLFAQYVKLEKEISADQPGWEAEMDAMGRPTVMIDHEFSSGVGAVFLRNTNWRCVWFDPIVAVFVHEKSVPATKVPAVDFLARHFHRDRSAEAQDLPTRLAMAKALCRYMGSTPPALDDVIQPFALLALDQSRTILHELPESVDGWKLLGQAEFMRQPDMAAPRFREPFDPVADLSTARATAAFRHALELAPSDFLTLFLLRQSFESRAMYEAALPLAERIAQSISINQLQAKERAQAGPIAEQYRLKLGPAPSATWQNLGELDQLVSSMLASGRVQGAADLLERANPPERASWDALDRIATLRLHLGEAARARELWQSAKNVPRPALRDARVAAAYLAEADYDRARKSYEAAIALEPKLFEARYGLAVLEADAGDAVACYKEARAAVSSAPDAASKHAASGIANRVSRFVSNKEDVANP